MGRFTGKTAVITGSGRRKGLGEAIAKRLAAKGATSLYSSPYVRCMQTLEPLGKRLGVAVQPEPRLYEGEPFEPVLELLRDSD